MSCEFDCKIECINFIILLYHRLVQIRSEDNSCLTWSTKGCFPLVLIPSLQYDTGKEKNVRETQCYKNDRTQNNKNQAEKPKHLEYIKTHTHFQKVMLF